MNRLLLASSCVMVSAFPAFAGISIVVTPSSAPNFFGSPSWGGYAANALAALRSNTLVNGDRNTDPTGYTGYTYGALIAPGDVIVTSYSSWRGVANPAAPFDSEYGNRLHFGLHATGDGTTRFTLDDVQFDMHSSDGDDSLAFSGDLSGLTYNGTTRIGYDWGVDRLPGTGDDIVYQAGESGSLPIDELVYVGIGNAFWPGADDADPGNPDLGRQGAIDDTAAYIGSHQPFTVYATYSIGAMSGGSLVYVPSAGVLPLLGMGGLAVCRRRR